MIRNFEEKDKQCFFDCCKEFYASDAVMENVSEKNFATTFSLLISGSDFVKGVVLECDGQFAGYGLMSVTYSNEVGAFVLWLEELFILPHFRKRGLGREFFQYVQQNLYKHYGRVRMEACAENITAVEWYRKLGFKNMKYIQLYKEI